MFVGWEGVGLCSYLLIGFWYEKTVGVRRRQEGVHRQPHRRLRRSCSACCCCSSRFGTLDFQEVARAASRAQPRDDVRHDLVDHAAALRRRHRQVGADSALRLAAGRDGRPDAGLRADPRGDDGDGGRLHDRRATRVLFSHAPQTLAIVAVDRRGDGADGRRRSASCRTTSSACSRTRPCRSSATCSWRWASARIAAGIFHLFTHAFFKALLFLGSGAVIHALHGEQDLRQDGRPARRSCRSPTGRSSIGALAIAGVPALAGFFSKDEILCRTFASGHTVLWVVGVLTALLTAIYMFRLVFLAFHGERAASATADARCARTEHARRPRRTRARTRICTTRRRRWRSRSSCWRSDRSWPATSACRRCSAAATGSSATSSRASAAAPAARASAEHGARRRR